MIRSLLRLPLCSAVAGSGLVGYMAAGGNYDLRAAWLGLGVLLAATGATILNQWQERYSDALMERTRCRPLASGQLRPSAGLGLGLGLAATGTLLLTGLSWRSGVLTLSIFLLYHFLYTPMKRRTILALLPGALCGALPPTIGWLAAGGRLQDLRLVTLTTLLLLWQIPHSWQILLRRRHDLCQAGIFPELHRLPPARLQKLIFVWILALSTATLLIPALIIPGSSMIRWLSLGLAAAPLIALLYPHAIGDSAPVAGWQRGTGVFFLGTVMGLLLFY
jgi:protoheme IX farnesyltransferase